MKVNYLARRVKGPKRFYRIVPTGEGLVDVWLSPGEGVPITDSVTRVTDYNIRLLAVQGVNPCDPQWGGDLEGHIRRHYRRWLASAEVIEI